MHSYTICSTNKKCIKFLICANFQIQTKTQWLNHYTCIKQFNKKDTAFQCVSQLQHHQSTQLSCSHLPQIHIANPFLVSSSVILETTKRHATPFTVNFSLSFNQSYVAFFCAGLDDQTVLSDFLLTCPFPLYLV